MEWLWSPETWISLVTLTVLEIVLGIDNIVFITILAGKLPPADQARARRLGLAAAMIMEGCGKEVHKGYVYFAMAFAVGVEALNLRVRSKMKVKLHQPYR